MRPAINLHDFRAMARRKLPQIAFDFIDGGSDDELGMVRNREAFSDYQLLPRYLNDVTVRDQSTTLFGRTYSSPIGISANWRRHSTRHWMQPNNGGTSAARSSRFTRRIRI